MTNRQKELHDWEWNVTFDDFCDQLKHGELSHESWLRNQQKKSLAGDLSEDKNGKLAAVLHNGWGSAHITGLRNCVRAGDIGIMKEPDKWVSFKESLDALNTDTEALSQ